MTATNGDARCGCTCRCQPFSTAPKDGRQFLSWDGIGWAISMFDQQGGFHAFAADGASATMRDENGRWTYQQSHWCPLPAGPNGEEPESEYGAS